MKASFQKFYVSLSMAFVFLVSCGLPATSGKIGGIVDNGNKPDRESDKSETSPDQSGGPGSSSGSNSDSPGGLCNATGNCSDKKLISILNDRFKVFVPISYEISEQQTGRTEFKDASGMVMMRFHEVQSGCEASGSAYLTKNNFAVSRCVENSNKVLIESPAASANGVAHVVLFELEYNTDEKTVTWVLDSLDFKEQ